MERVEGWVLRHRITLGVILFAVGIGASVLLAVLASTSAPPNAAASALLVLVGSIFNVGGAIVLARRPGGPNLTAARIAASHLSGITGEVVELRMMAEEAFESRSPGKGRDDIGALNWRLNAVQNELLRNQEDWARAYPALIENVTDTSKGEEPNEQ